VLFSHYYISGARITSKSRIEISPNEFQLSRDIIPENIKIAVFGHIHLHQVISERPHILYTGAVERIDWGEKNDTKGFISISLPQFNWKFIELPARPMHRIKASISPDDRDYMTKILDSIGDVQNSIVILELEVDEGMRSKIDMVEIGKKLKTAFHYDIKWKERTSSRHFVSFSTDYFALLDEYIKLNYNDHPKLNTILVKARELLREAIE
jgi:exonuclease SbcD